MRAKRGLKLTVGLVGIIVTILGWYLNNVDRYTWVIKVLAPKYIEALSAYEVMLTSARASPSGGPPVAPVVMNAGDRGFSEILFLLADKFPETRQSTVTRMTITDVGLAIGVYAPETGVYYSGVQPALEITLKDGKTLARYVNDLRPEIRGRFLEEPLFHWSMGLFWAGIAISFVALFVPEK